MLIDSHCHLSHMPKVAGGVAAICEQAASANVHGMLTIATTPDALAAMQADCAEQPYVWCAAGLHPEAVNAQNSLDLQALEHALIHVAGSAVVALGETGLDYSPAASPGLFAAQRDAFALHLELARRFDLPVIVHTRNAVADTLDLIRAYPGCRGVIHCFTEDQRAGEAFIALDFLLSFSGILTFRNAEALRRVAADIDAQMMLVETDSPYLAPVPMRGKSNHPAWVAHTAACMADVRGTSREQIAHTTTANFARLFQVDVAHIQQTRSSAQAVVSRR